MKTQKHNLSISKKQSSISDFDFFKNPPCHMLISSVYTSDPLTGRAEAVNDGFPSVVFLP